MDNSGIITNIVVWKGSKYRRSWIPSEEVSKFIPFKQIYGIVFNDKSEVLVISEEPGKWQIPGGTPEYGETSEQTITREFIEEADVTLKNIKFIGAQKIEYFDQDNPNKEEGNLFYQLRFVADVDKILPQTPDPDGGNIHPRKFVNFNELTKYVNWGDIGEALFKRAWEVHRSSL